MLNIPMGFKITHDFLFRPKHIENTSFMHNYIFHIDPFLGANGPDREGQI